MCMVNESDIFAGTKPGAVSEPCASCGVRCCNRFAVPLSGFDVVRIAARTGLEPKEFCELADSKNIEAAPHSLVFIFRGGKIEERLLTLIRKKNMYCVFSKHSKGCGVWGAHPFVCRAYPFRVDESGEIKYVKNFVCPRKWEKNEYLEDVVRRIVEKQNREIIEHNKIVRRWNAEFAAGNKEGEKGFFDYLIRECVGR